MTDEELFHAMSDAYVAGGLPRVLAAVAPELRRRALAEAKEAVRGVIAAEWSEQRKLGATDAYYAVDSMLRAATPEPAQAVTPTCERHGWVHCGAPECKPSPTTGEPR